MSRRVLLLIEDYVENSRLVEVLKKIGFDVVGQGNENGLGDKILAFHPDLVVVCGTSSRLSAVSVGMKLRDVRGFTGSVILGMSKEDKISSHDLLKVRVDRILEAPIHIEALIRNVCEVLHLDAESHIEKFNRIQWSQPEDKLQFIRGGSGEALEKTEVSRLTQSHSRQERFRKALANLDIPISDTTFHRATVRDKWAEVKKDWDFDLIDEINELKREFTDALFDRSEPKNEGETTEGNPKVEPKKKE